MIDMLGYLIMVINLVSMSMKSELYLRILSMIANILLFFYACLLGSTPLALGGIIAAAIHTFRIVKKNNAQAS